VQIVGYETAPTGEKESPAIQVATDGVVSRHSLDPGIELDYHLGGRHCAGVIDGERHHSCDRGATPYCEAHASRWACARCRGGCELPLESCREEHAIYLAAFAPDIFKVGVTRSWRLRTRLREQGADRAVHLQTVENGRIARQIEREIASDIPERVQISAKRRGIHRAIDESAWAALLSEFEPLETYDFDYNLTLDRRPQRETLARGIVEGTKGRLLVVQNRRSAFAVDLRDLVGHELVDGERGAHTDGRVQASFATFE
jgi:hypothetical protein